MDKVSPIRRKPTPKPPVLLLTEQPAETFHRVACILRYLSAHTRDTDLTWTEDEEFGRMILLRDLAAALDYAHEAGNGGSPQAAGAA